MSKHFRFWALELNIYSKYISQCSNLPKKKINKLIKNNNYVRTMNVTDRLKSIDGYFIKTIFRNIFYFI